MRIIHPRPAAGAQSALGVDFIDGVATVESLHPERELALLQHGYTIEKDLDVEVPYHGALGEEIIDLTKLTIPELREIADHEGVTVPSKAKHAEIVELLSRIPATPIPGSVDNGDGSFTAAGYATVELADGTVVGDGTSIVTLHDDGTATTED